MEEAYAITNEMLRKLLKGVKSTMTQKVERSSVLQPGDQVLIKNLTPRGGPGRLCDYWEDTAYTLVRQMGSDLLIYKVRPEKDQGRSIVLHRHLLISCDYLTFETQPGVTKENKINWKRRHQPAS